MEEELRYPIGRYKVPYEFTPQILKNYISEIESLPFKLKQEVTHLPEEQLDTTYRPGGWTIRQVVHHLADSHMNALTRVKLALTEETPVIKPYMENYWAELADNKLPIKTSMLILEGVHERWSVLLKSFTEREWKKSFIHPEKGRELTLYESTGSYAWHGNHHLAHITQLKQRNNWR